MRVKHCPDDGTIMVKQENIDDRPEWYCPTCGATAPLRVSGTAPTITLHLSDEQLEWLRANGGIQPTIKRLIRQEMESEAVIGNFSE